MTQIRDDAFIISDTHFGHSAIIKYANRPFKSVQAMDEEIRCNWNATVRKTDQIIFLGDFALANADSIRQYFKELNGKKCMIMGNHDRTHSIKWWLDIGFEWVIDCPIIYKEFFILSHEPIEWVSERLPVCNIHGHMHEKTCYNRSNHHINASVEQIQYTPARLSDYIDGCRQYSDGIE